MKDSKTIKVKTIAGTVVTLACTAIMTMAPLSQAQAVGLHQVGSNCSSKGKVQTCRIVYRAEGGASGSVSKAKADAKRRAFCPNFSSYVRGSARWGQQGRWKNWDWYYADIQFTCDPSTLSQGKVNGLPIPVHSAVNDLR